MHAFQWKLQFAYILTQNRQSEGYFPICFSISNSVLPIFYNFSKNNIFTVSGQNYEVYVSIHRCLWEKMEFQKIWKL